MGSVMRLRILSRVDLPAPLRPMMPNDLALLHFEVDVAQRPELLATVRAVPAGTQPAQWRPDCTFDDVAKAVSAVSVTKHVALGQAFDRDDVSLMSSAGALRRLPGDALGYRHNGARNVVVQRTRPEGLVQSFEQPGHPPMAPLVPMDTLAPLVVAARGTACRNHRHLRFRQLSAMRRSGRSVAELGRGPQSVRRTRGPRPSSASDAES